MADFKWLRYGRALAFSLSALLLAPMATDADASEEQRYPAGRFWNDGVAFVGVDPDEEDRFDGVVIDDAGSVYAVGSAGPDQGGPRVTLVAKFTSSGELDPIFGGTGIIELDLSPYQGTPDDPTTPEDEGDDALEEGRDIAIQSDGRVVVVARSEDPLVADPDANTETVLSVFRLEPDGSIDPSFGVDGVARIDIAGDEDETAWGIEVDDQDRIYVAGHGTAHPDLGGRTDRDRYGFRLTPRGDLDTSWGLGIGGGGIVTGDVFSGSTDNQRRAHVFPDGTSLAAGYSNIGGRNQIILISVDPDGLQNLEFSGDGVLRFTPLPLGMAEAYGAVPQSDGSFVTAGYGRRYQGEVPTGTVDPGLDLVSFRITPSGEFDTSWGKNGALVYNIANFRERARALVRLPNDSMLMAGTGEPIADDRDAMLFLATPNGRPDRLFDRDVHKLYDFGGTNEEFRDVAISPSGEFAVAVGFSTGGSLDNTDATLLILPVPRHYQRPPTPDRERRRYRW